MNQLVAKIRERGVEYDILKKIISNQNIFHIYDSLKNEVVYNPSTLLEDEEWYSISDFSSQQYCPDYLKGFVLNTVDYEQLDKASLAQVDYVFSYENDYFFFQNVTKSQLIKKKLIVFGEEFYFDANNNALVIKEVADAVYDKEKDKLMFRKLSSISSIFKGIDQLYREASEEDTRLFLDNDFITLHNGFSSVDVKTANRKRIALASDTLNGFREEDRRKVFYYIRDYCPNLSNNGDSFAISNETDLKMLLFGIEQRFYTTPVGEEKRIANSVIKI